MSSSSLAEKYLSKKPVKVVKKKKTITASLSEDVITRIPTIPKRYNIGSDANAEYKLVCKSLIAEGRLTESDLQVCFLLARCYHDYFLALASIEENGLEISGVNKMGAEYTATNPSVYIREKQDNLISGHLKQLGLTPYIRKRLNIKKVVVKKSDADNYLEN